MLLLIILTTGIDEPPKSAPPMVNKSTKSLPLSTRNLPLDLPSDSGPPSTTPPSQVSPMSSLERGRKSLHKKGPLLGPEIKVLIVWLESFDDREAFPLGELRSNCFVISSASRGSPSEQEGVRLTA